MDGLEYSGGIADHLQPMRKSLIQPPRLAKSPTDGTINAGLSLELPVLCRVQPRLGFFFSVASPNGGYLLSIVYDVHPW